MIGAPLLRPWLEQLAELSPLVAILAKVTLLLAVAWGAHGLLTRANPRWRVLLWCGATVGLLLIPLCHFLMPPIKFQAPVATVAGANIGATDTASGQPAGAVAEPMTPAIVLLPSADDFLRHEPVVTALDADGNHSWWPFLFAVWSGGCLFCLVRIIIGLRLIRSLVVGSEPASGGVQAEFTRVAQDLWLEDKSEVQQRVRALQRRVFDRSLNWQLAGAAVASCLIFATALGGFKAVRADVLDEPPPSVSDLQTTESDEQTAKRKDEVTGGAAKANRSDLVTAETDTAVNKALAFLAARQRADGSFGGEVVGQRDPAMTALCGMAMLAAGSKPGDGPYGAAIQKALDFLLKHVHDSGFIGIQDDVGSLYVHAYALRFLAEAQQASKMPGTESAISKTVDLIVKSQNARDGWRYSTQSQDADSSVTSCLVIALESARRAGVEVPQETRHRAIKYLQSCQTRDGGFAYVSDVGQSALPRSASVMAAMYLSGVDDEQSRKGLAYLNAKATPPNRKAPYFFFSQFHLSTALRYAGDEHFRRWYEPNRDELLQMQEDDGRWSLQYYEPEYATAKACIVLLSPRGPIVRMPADDNAADADASP
jgi:hypothetical protein